jgi:peptidoglycan/LPS O-acetylase OafA/YrhL
LLFLQSDVGIGTWQIPLLRGNTNLWSLNYEVLYYLIFLAIWVRPRWWPAWLIATFVAGASAWRIPLAGEAIATYASGWVFWLAGYGLARSPRAGGITGRLPWPSLLLLWLATWHLKPMWWVAHRYALLPENSAWMNYSFCDFLPVCVSVLMAASDRRPRFARSIANASLAIMIAFSAWRFARGRTLAETGFNYDAVVLFAAALWWWRPPATPFARLAPLGMISYAIYILQRPVQWWIRDHAPLPSGTVVSFSLRIVIAATVTLGVAYVAERMLQPRIRHWLQPAKRTTAAEPVGVG